MLLVAIGILIGALLVNMQLEKTNRELKRVKRQKDYFHKEYLNETLKVVNRDKLIKDYQEEAEILLNNSAELRTENKTLKELITDRKSEN